MSHPENPSPCTTLRAPGAAPLPTRKVAPVAAVALLLTCLLGGCGIAPRYEVADGVPKARLRNVTFSTATQFRSVLGGDCTTGLRRVSAVGPISIQNNDVLGMPGRPDLPKGAMEEVYIAADQPYFSSSLTRLGSAYTGWLVCGPVNVMFDPQPGVDYELAFIPVNDSAGRGCTVEVYRLRTLVSETRREPEPSARPFECAKP